MVRTKYWLQEVSSLGVGHPLEQAVLVGHHAAHLVLKQPDLDSHHVDGQGLEEVLQGGHHHLHDVQSKVLYLLHASLTTVLVHELADLALHL